MCVFKVMWQDSVYFCYQYFDTCKMINKAQGCETQKTGSQVQVSLCISEAEKQVQSLKDEVHTNIAHIISWSVCL